jgi:hypothetical protein
VERFNSPTGRMIVITDEVQQLRVVDWGDCERRMRDLFRRHYGEGLSSCARPPAYAALARTERSPATVAGSRESNGCWRTKGSTSRAAQSVIRDAGAGLKDNAGTHPSGLGEVIGNRNWTEVCRKIGVKCRQCPNLK